MKNGKEILDLLVRAYFAFVFVGIFALLPAPATALNPSQTQSEGRRNSKDGYDYIKHDCENVGRYVVKINSYLYLREK